MVELILLTVPACPNAEAFEERLAAALAGHPRVVVRRREVADEREAAEAGMHGSPTLLIDGVDPFAQPGQAPSVSSGSTGMRTGTWPECRRWRRCGRRWRRPVMTERSYDGHHLISRFRHGRARQLRPRAVSRAGTEPASYGLLLAGRRSGRASRDWRSSCRAGSGARTCTG